jgi:hypothetical protein
VGTFDVGCPLQRGTVETLWRGCHDAVSDLFSIIVTGPIPAQSPFIPRILRHELVR